MNIAIVGTGYVGLVSGTCFAELGANVYCIDIDETKIKKLQEGIVPIYEPGLEEMVKRNLSCGRLIFSTDLTSCLDKVEVIFSAVGTPPDEDGSADLKYVLQVAKTVGKNMNNYKLLVTKSTVPVGTATKVKNVIKEELDARGVNIPFDVASNPEFLKEGDAIDDFLRPERIVVGVESDRARELMEHLYRSFILNGNPVIFTDIASAEMIKYAANAMLATRISFMNEIANLCDIVGADINMVRQGIGSDSRIGKKFLYAGCGYGGSCFPKDVKALINTGASMGLDMKILKAAEEVNGKQKLILVEKLKQHFNSELQGKRIALWGIAFKPNTDDIREAPSLEIITELLSLGAEIHAYDPIAIDLVRDKFQGNIHFHNDFYSTTQNADAILLITEWKEFRIPDWKVIKKNMRTPVVFDGRNIFESKHLIKNGFTYIGIGTR